MNKFLLAIGLALIVYGFPAHSNELGDDESKIDEISDHDADAEAVDEVADMPTEGDEQQREAALPPGRVAQPRRNVSDQIDSALANLRESEANNSVLEKENGSLRHELSRWKIRCADDRKPASSKNKKITAKKSLKKKIAKSRPMKRSGKVEITKARKKKIAQKKTPNKRMIASIERSHGLPATLPKKKFH